MDEFPQDAVSSLDASIGRRDALKRAAVAGGAVVWAVPVVQAIGTRGAFAVSGPPPPPPPPRPPSDFHGISYVGIVFRCGTEVYRVKWEEGGGWGDYDGDNLPFCDDPDGWSTANAYSTPSQIGVSTDYVGDDLYRVTFTLPAGCEIKDGEAGVAKGGNPTKTGYCAVGAVSAAKQSITFTAPPKP